MKNIELHDSEFIQYKVAPGQLLGQIEQLGATTSRIRLFPQPEKWYFNDENIRTIEVSLTEYGFSNFLWVHNAEVERWTPVNDG